MDDPNCDKPDCPDNDLCFETQCLYRRQPEKEQTDEEKRRALTRGKDKGAI